MLSYGLATGVLLGCLTEHRVGMVTHRIMIIRIIRVLTAM